MAQRSGDELIGAIEIPSVTSDPIGGDEDTEALPAPPDFHDEPRNFHAADRRRPIFALDENDRWELHRHQAAGCAIVPASDIDLLGAEGAVFVTRCDIYSRDRLEEVSS